MTLSISESAGAFTANLETAGPHMAKTIKEWKEKDIEAVSDPDKRRWLGEEFFFRDPGRPMYIDSSYFFSPADGVILYQKRVAAGDPIVDIKGVPYSLRDALRAPQLEGDYLVIGIFMTLYDVHVNRSPYSGNLSYRSLPAIETHNWPMIGVETALLEEAGVWAPECEYLHKNQRMLNRIFASNLGLTYHVLQIADYDVGCITPFELAQNVSVAQNQRFSQIRFGSQVDLIIPLTPRLDFQLLQQDSMHVEAGVDTLVKIVEVAPVRN
jgi:phosphatidylserine decarboxylase